LDWTTTPVNPAGAMIVGPMEICIAAVGPTKTVPGPAQTIGAPALVLPSS
jgi:hypothetical protein